MSDSTTGPDGSPLDFTPAEAAQEKDDGSSALLKLATSVGACAATFLIAVSVTRESPSLSCSISHGLPCRLRLYSSTARFRGVSGVGTVTPKR
jgi:hypothetical protein